MSAEPMTEERLKEIGARAREGSGFVTEICSSVVLVEDVPALVAEVRRLRAALIEIRDNAKDKMGQARYFVDMTGFMTIGVKADDALGEPKPEGT